MHRVGLASVLFVLLGLAPAAEAAEPPKELTRNALSCLQERAREQPGIGSWVAVRRGRLDLDVDAQGRPSGYEFDATFLSPEEGREGSWSYDDGVVAFTSGPLANAATGWNLVGTYSRRGHRMLHDSTPLRRFMLQLRSLSEEHPPEGPAHDEAKEGDLRSYWYCDEPGILPRRVFLKDLSWVQRRSRLRVKLPNWVQPPQYETATGAPGYADVRGRVRTATRGAWRFELIGTRDECEGGDCPSLGVFSARRIDGRPNLSKRRPVRLAKGVRGWVGSVGCGSSARPREWPPLYCGQPIIVWRTNGVEYAIQMQTAERRLVRYANLTLRVPMRYDVVRPPT